MSRKIHFTKMHGAGNDYIYVNTLEYPVAEPERFAREWSDRHKGIGGDGLVLIGKDTRGDFSMRIFNNDGSEARMCGNASRCIGKYLYEYGLTSKTEVMLSTLSGQKKLCLHLDGKNRVDSVTVDMGEPCLNVPTQIATHDGAMTEGEVASTTGEKWTGTFVSMGNPHFVIFVDDVENLALEKVGPTLESASIFPERCNIEFATALPDGNIRMRVWERGSGVTLACGTGACATAVASCLTHRTGRSVRIVMDGGTLSIEWSAADSHVLMTGPATQVFDGVIETEE